MIKFNNILSKFRCTPSFYIPFFFSIFVVSRYIGAALAATSVEWIEFSVAAIVFLTTFSFLIEEPRKRFGLGFLTLLAIGPLAVSHGVSEIGWQPAHVFWFSIRFIIAWLVLALLDLNRERKWARTLIWCAGLLLLLYFSRWIYIRYKYPHGFYFDSSGTMHGLP